MLHLRVGGLEIFSVYQNAWNLILKETLIDLLIQWWRPIALPARSR